MTESSAFSHLVGIHAKRREWESLHTGALETEKAVIRVASGSQRERRKRADAQGPARQGPDVNVWFSHCNCIFVNIKCVLFNSPLLVLNETHG